MQRIFKTKFAVIAIVACCSLSLMSFTDNEELYGTSQSVSNSTNQNADDEDVAITGIFRAVYAFTRAVCPHVVDDLGRATRHATTLTRNEYTPIFKIADFQKKTQSNKFKKLG